MLSGNLENNEEIEKIRLIQKLWQLRNFFRKTDFNSLPYLQDVADKITSERVPLTPLPASPLPQEIDQEKADKFVAQFASSQMQETARKIIGEHITYISFEEFQNRLHDAMFKFNQYLLAKKVDVASFSVAVEKDHSSEWVASLAARYFNFVPRKYHQIDCSEMYRMYTSFDFSQVKGREHTLAIFDDWSISGTQLSGILRNIVRAKKDARREFKLNVVVVIPLMTYHAYRTNIEAFKNETDLSLRIITTKFVPSLHFVKSVLSKSELGDLNEMMHLDRDADSSRFPPQYSKMVFAFSDWKVPDYVSMPNQIATGYIPWKLTPYDNKPCSEVPKEANGNKFIPDVQSPYHKKRRFW